jgi:hypothetical protein
MNFRGVIPTHIQRPLPTVPAAVLYRRTVGSTAYFIQRGCRQPPYMGDLFDNAPFVSTTVYSVPGHLVFMGGISESALQERKKKQWELSLSGFLLFSQEASLRPRGA